MITLTLGNVSITSIGQASGIFMGQSNTSQKFRSNSIIEEVVGALSGNENTIINNDWLNNKQGEDN